jgi:hypothetical protein
MVACIDAIRGAGVFFFKKDLVNSYFFYYFVLKFKKNEKSITFKI